MARSEAAKKKNVARQTHIGRVEVRMCGSRHAVDYTNEASIEKRFLSCFGQMKAEGVVPTRLRPMSLTMKNALVLGATGGIGRAVVATLKERGAQVTGLSRSDGLDVTDPASVDRMLAALEGPFDLIFVAIGILAPSDGSPEKALTAIEASAMSQVFAVNAIGPALILRHAPRVLAKDKRGVVAVLSARVGSIGDNQIGGWHSYRASKAAVNQIVHGAAIELGRSHKQSICVALHPGTVETPFTADYAGRHKTVPAAEAASNLLTVIDGLTPDETGGFFDYAGKRIPW